MLAESGFESAQFQLLKLKMMNRFQTFAFNGFILCPYGKETVAAMNADFTPNNDFEEAIMVWGGGLTRYKPSLHSVCVGCTHGISPRCIAEFVLPGFIIMSARSYHVWY